MRLHHVLIGSMLLTGCAPSANDTRQIDSAATARSYDALAYNLKASFDWTKKQLTGTEQITLALSGTQKVELDSVVNVSRVHVGDFDLPFTQDATAKTLTVDLTKLHPASLASFTVEYTAGTSDALLAAGPRDGDPVASRVVFTDSEPDRGAQWLVANHHPADRAIWSVELTVDADEDVIANGERVLDTTSRGKRTVGFAMPLPIPTYLMAFAAGQITHADRQLGRIPLSVWYRKGLLIDPQQNLDAIADAMTTFQKLLGPYPWERYSVVLLPDYYGGMENATITFNYEPSGQGLVDFTINAHELSHHWFGDWVTMHDFDDVWVKEGMATVLESEADRARRDTGNSGRLFGIDFTFQPQDAVVDDGLKGEAKYTSGPYQRAAWLITQIRAKVGEKNFWASLRKVLATYPLGSITGPQFVQAFAPALDQASITQLVNSLPNKPVPSLTTDATFDPSTNTATVTATMSDPGQQIITPPTITTIDAEGNATVQTLATNVPVTIALPTGGYVAPDEHDVHPDWLKTFTTDGGFYSLLGSYMPTALGPAMTAFETRSPAQQERALAESAALYFDPAQFGGFYAALQSRTARASAETDGCSRIQMSTLFDDPTTAAGWSSALGPIVASPAVENVNWGYGACGPDFASQFSAELDGDVAAPTVANAPRINYLMSYDYGVQPSFAVLSKIATTAPSEQEREYAMQRVVEQIFGGGYTGVTDPADLVTWSAFIEQQLAISTSEFHFEWLIDGALGLNDVSAMPVIANKLPSIPLSAGEYTWALCGLYNMAQGQQQPDAWTSFVSSLSTWMAPAEAQAALSDPLTACATPFVAQVSIGGRALDKTPIGSLVNRPDGHVGHQLPLQAPPQQ